MVSCKNTTSITTKIALNLTHERHNFVLKNAQHSTWYTTPDGIKHSKEAVIKLFFLEVVSFAQKHDFSNISQKTVRCCVERGITSHLLTGSTWKNSHFVSPKVGV